MPLTFNFGPENAPEVLAKRAKTPVTLLAGFLGAGKTTLLKHLLQNKDGLRIGVVVNDLASVNIDGQLLRVSLGDVELVELQNGCICCSSADDLFSAVQTIVMRCKDNPFEHILVELSGVGDPQAIRRNWAMATECQLPAALLTSLARVITVVDASTFAQDWQDTGEALPRNGTTSPTTHESRRRNASSQEMVGQLLAQQVELADVVIINKCDIVSDEELNRTLHVLQALNGTARQYQTDFGRVPTSVLPPVPFGLRIVTKGHEEGYSWSQTPREVQICMSIPENVKSKDIECSVKKRSLTLGFKSQKIACGTLAGEVACDDTMFEIDGEGSERQVLLSLEKKDVGMWRSSSSKLMIDHALTSATAMGSFSFGQTMPWELTPLLKDVFGEDATPWLKPPKIPRTLPRLSSVASCTPMTMVHKQTAIQLKSYEKVLSQKDPERASLVLKWMDLVLINLEASMVGRQILQDYDKVGGGDNGLQILHDTLTGKSTNTLKVRSSSLAMFCGWMAKFRENEPIFPVCEEHVYEYLGYLRSHFCSATRGSTFLATLTFCGHILGLEGACDCAQSGRCKGVALELYMMKRPLRQAAELTASMLCVLELSCFCHPDSYTRALMGYCMCCIYGRLRVSDMARLVHISNTGRFAEGSLMRVKTARNKEKQCTFLPVIIPSLGILGLPWFEAFLITRDMLQLEELPTLSSGSDDRSLVVLPSRNSAHRTICDKVTAGEVSHELRSVLGSFFPAEDIKNISSHSLKTTLLTYLGKAGCDYTHCELLGYHLTQHKSAINYQRCALAEPMRFLTDMLSKIHTGEFIPGAARHMMFPSSGFAPMQEQFTQEMGIQLIEICDTMLGFSSDIFHEEECEHEMKVLWDLLCSLPQDLEQRFEPTLSGKSGTEPATSEGQSDEDVSPDASSDSDSDSVESCLARVAGRVGTRSELGVSRNALTSTLFRYSRTGMLHYGHVDDSSKTACGRIMGPSQRVERKDEDTPRRLAQAERSARYEDQKNRLIGLELTGELEPSHALIDLVYQMREDGQLRYIRWEQCTKRDQELLGVKVDPIWKPDGNGIIKEVKVDTSSYMEAFTSPPPDGHLRVSIQQIHRADLELFKVMMRETRGGIKSFTGAPPLEDALKVAMNATEVRLLLQPLQGSLKRKGEAQDAEEKRNKSSSSSSSQVEKLQRTVENLQGQLKNLRAKSQDNPPNRKGKGRGKGKFNMIRMPPQLIGLSPTNGDNEPICFDFNLKGCSRAKAGERCEKGWHSCMKCFKPHSQKDHQ
eukprot:symbB.v1.2.013853.t1/scaffold989.1/size146301/3